MRITLLALAMIAAAGAAQAQATLSIPLDPGTSDNVQSYTYVCGDGAPFAVQYVNAGANALAILPVEDENRIFVNVVSGSGARYVSGAHVWWTKGDTATLENELQENSLQQCRMHETAPAE